MKINTIGVTRIVVEFDNVVWKIPNFTGSWLNFLKGLVANIQENKTWKWNSGKYEKGTSYLLCPVLFCCMGGWILIMKKAEKVFSYDEFWSMDLKLIDEHLSNFPGDDTAPNYGVLNNKIVKIDYGSLN